MRILNVIYEEGGDLHQYQFQTPMEVRTVQDIMVYFNPSRYVKDLDQEDKLVLLYKIAMAALVSANGEEEAKRIMIALGCDKICDITEIEKIHKQVSKALNMPQAEVDKVFHKVMDAHQAVRDKAEEVAIITAVDKAVNMLKS